jgi:hypothetical protein
MRKGYLPPFQSMNTETRNCLETCALISALCTKWQIAHQTQTARQICFTLLTIYCTMLGSPDHFWPPVVRVMPLDAVQIVNWFIYNLTHVTTITHNYFLRCATCTQLTIIHVRDYNHLLHSYTGWLLSYQFLSQIITDSTSSHFETLAENLLREFTS